MWLKCCLLFLEQEMIMFWYNMIKAIVMDPKNAWTIIRQNVTSNSHHGSTYSTGHGATSTSVKDTDDSL